MGWRGQTSIVLEMVTDNFLVVLCLIDIKSEPIERQLYLKWKNLQVKVSYTHTVATTAETKT